MAPAPRSSFVVYSTAGQYDVLPASAKAILGEYTEEGSNHGKRVYKRTAGEGQDDLPEIVLFYWDMRDGKDLSGWWFGDKVGGGQVWARNATMSATPPQRGWRCPVDGPVQGHVLCKPKLQTSGEGSGEADDLDGDTLKRGFEGDAKGGPVRKRHQRTQTLVLVSKNATEPPKGADALLGEYVHQGTNHGKKTFLKEASNGSEAVWLYYWDSRDGKEFSGWWLGSSVGGEQVYAKADQHSAMPPIKGWRIPHDGAKSDISLMLKGHEEDTEMPEEERLQKVKDKVSSLESKVDKAVETSQKMLEREGDVFEEGIRAICQMLESRVGDLEDAKAAAVRHSKAAKKQKASNETEAELGLLEERLDSALGKALKEAARAQERLASCELEGAEERDAKAVEAALPGCTEVVAQAEMAVEAASTDDAAMKARDLIQAARLRVGSALEAARAYAPEAQKVALTEFTSLQDRCVGAEKRLALWEGSGLTNLDGMPSKAIDVDGDADDDGPTLVDGAADGDATPRAEPTTAEDGDEGLEDVDITDFDTSLPEDDLLKQMTSKVAEVEGDAKQALETATIVLKDDSDIKGVKLCLDLLQEHYDAVRTAQGKLSKQVGAVKTKSMTPASAEAINALGPRLQVVRAHISQELELAKRRVARAQRQAREERDLQVAEIAMPLALEAVAQAEDAVEAVVMDAGDMDWRRKQMETAVQFGDEYGDEIQQAMEETQTAADSAQDAISAARTRLDAQIRAARLLPAEQQKAALADMAPVRRRLIDAQKKLNPYKRIRVEFEQQLKAKGELESYSSRVAAIEADIEGVKSALEGASTSEDDVKSVEVTLGPMQTALGKVLKLLEQRSKGVTGALEERLSGIRERGIAARGKLEDLRARARSERSQLAGQTLTQLAAREVEKAESWLSRVKEVEAPWAGGAEVLPEVQAGPALEAAEALTAEALPALQATKTLLMEQLVEARQLPEGILRLKTTEDLQRFQARVDTVSLQVTQLKIDGFARKTKMQMTDVIQAVAKAEQEVQKIVKAGEPFGEDNLKSVTAKELRDVSAKVNKCVGPITKVCEEARKTVTSKQQDPRNKTSPSFNTQLSKLAGRLESVEATVSGMQKAAKEAEGSKKRLQEQEKELAGLEKTVAAVELLALPLGDEQPTEQDEEATALRVRDAQEALGTWQAAAQELARHPHGALKLAMGRLLEEAGRLQQRLVAARAMVREQCERGMCRIAVREARAQLPKAEQVMRQAEEAEGPFLKGIENLSPAQSAEAIAACEAAAVRAKAVIGEVQSFIVAKHREVSGYTLGGEGWKASVDELAVLVHQAEALVLKLAQYQSETDRRKRAAAKHDAEPPAKAARIS